MRPHEAHEISRELRVRRMDENGVGLALEWAAAEGWNPGRHDASCFYAADPYGFFLADLDGEPVGCISAVAYDAAFGFLGLYIVKPSYRGRGFGLKLWDTAMAYMGTRNVGLDGVVAQQDNYKKSGFKLAYRNMRYQGTGGGAEPAGLVELSSVSFDEICRYDATVFPAPRARLLRRWIDQPGAVALGVLSGQSLAGYGVARPSRTGFRIGPLFADAAHIAGALFEGLSSRLRGEPIFLDTTEANPRSADLAQRYGMEPMFETARMYTDGVPAGRSDRCFGLTSLEIG
ncbi:GCN5-related N-acetyltransferase [Rhodomicrobium vannielii ATCC 17100]|uniref:GCN5-related N-acetyltransferase n=1 Tax=Rhodomicrobium vannielii (strain ATCC 17100 / DSM 162 / LMG 4299 / NCIMB 10020 / ATH 3.1.1) TaxID=648757 RepID=E3I0G7_RHOVT|nr:GNAT family N-acetyltransferase [Rhodomicrobium vannielii]ADP72285.1 GCN5-related N-acetyltransferase [Rhodomicrobium vannielii ATCC 17100]